MSDIKLTHMQNIALLSMKSGKNVFLTGPGGSGKSFLLKYFIDWYNESSEQNQDIQRIYVTSTTGLSSILINGMTIHRFSGIGTGEKDVETLYKKIIKMKNLKNRWQNTEILIIDEISMLEADIFDKLDILARKIRKVDEPFGGIQLILSGDFLQLPPIKSDNFCFEAFSWDEVIHETFYFDKIIRQNDEKLQLILNNIRLGVVNEDVKKLLDSRLNINLDTKDGIVPTLLFSKKNMVIMHNEQELNKLINNGCENYIYNSYYEFGKNITEESKQFYKELINSQYSVDDNLKFALNSQVMLTVNMPEHELANGSRGIITSFNLGIPIVRFLNGVTLEIKQHEFVIDEGGYIVKKCQTPLILAWAITIHKAQGMSLELVKTDIGNSIFEYGQAYVVLSRIKTIEGLSLINIDYSKIKAHPKILKYYNKLM
jgi:ATP-dependent DNA helicase PIF1